MADATTAATGATGGEGSKPKRPYRNYRSRGGRGNGGANGRRRSADDEAGEAGEGGPKRERVPSVPVPPEMVGKTGVLGKVCDVVKKQHGQFGFIYIGEGEAAKSDAPRIYFNFKDYEAIFPPRRGYLVQFNVMQDEAGRAYAGDVKLTEQGVLEATIRDEEFKKKLAAEGKEPRPPRERRERRERRDDAGDDSRTVTLKVTCEGKVGEKQVTAKVGQSIGRLKYTIAAEWDAPTEYSVFCHGGNTMLTKALLEELAEGDVIHLKPAPAVTETA